MLPIIATRMKHYAYYRLFLALCGIVLLAPSCKSDSPGKSEEQPKSDVTVMIYGSGGGSLDRSMITLNTLREGIRNSGVRFSSIYIDCCLMNCLEYQFGLKDLCDYIVASTYGQTAFDQAVGWSAGCASTATSYPCGARADSRRNWMTMMSKYPNAI